MRITSDVTRWHIPPISDMLLIEPSPERGT
jgi:hypothetical protein